MQEASYGSFFMHAVSFLSFHCRFAHSMQEASYGIICNVNIWASFYDVENLYYQQQFSSLAH